MSNSSDAAKALPADAHQQVFGSQRQFVKAQAVIACLRFLGLLHLLFIAVIFLLCVLLRWVNPPFTSLMFYRVIHNRIHAKPVVYTPYEKIPPLLKTMIVDIEDDFFYKHHGIDLGAMREAMQRNKIMGGRYFGGSTITQQLSRSLFLWPEKSLVRKYLEIFIALEMDLVLPKKRILELYLNYVEWGRGVWGVGAISRHYFGKPPMQLTKEEMVCLTTLLASPVRFHQYNYQRLYGRYDLLRKKYLAWQPPLSEENSPQSENNATLDNRDEQNSTQKVLSEPNTDNTLQQLNPTDKNDDNNSKE